MRVRKFSSTTLLSESAKKSIPTPHGRVFKGVTLIKSGLGNRRDKNYYPPEALKAGVDQGLFEGLRAFADHPDSISEEIQPERSIRDMVGVYENAHFDNDAQSVRADLRILRHQSWLSEAIDELIDAGHGDKIGLSINGRGETEPARRHLEEAGGEVEVNELKRFIELRSTDVVTEAGAGGGFSELLESARRAKESGTMKATKSEVFAQLREAVRKGDTAKAKDLEKKYDAAADDEPDDDADDKPTSKTKEMGNFDQSGKMRKGRKTYEAKDDATDEDDDVREAGDEDDEEVDHDAALDEAADDAMDPDAEDDEDADLDEADEDEESEDDDEVQEADEPPARDTRGAQDKFRRSREAAAIKGGLGPKTGTVTSGVGRFTTKARPMSSGSKVNTKTTMGFKRGRKGRRTTESSGGGTSAATQIAILREQNARLRETVTRQQSINTATRLLKEDARIPPAVRPHLLRDLIGLSKRDMLAEINKQASIIEAATRGAVEHLSDDFDEVEGAGTTTVRESYHGSRDGDDVGSILAEVGLPMKR
jgi:hypothetical protein